MNTALTEVNGLAAMQKPFNKVDLDELLELLQFIAEHRLPLTKCFLVVKDEQILCRDFFDEDSKTQDHIALVWVDKVDVDPFDGLLWTDSKLLCFLTQEHAQEFVFKQGLAGCLVENALDLKFSELRDLEAPDYVVRVQHVASSLLITKTGSPDRARNAWLAGHGFSVSPGETDRFGWLTGVIHLPDHGTIVYG